jgi:hypothetical protein
MSQNKSRTSNELSKITNTDKETSVSYYEGNIFSTKLCKQVK